MFTPSHQSRLPKLKAGTGSLLESSKSPPLPQAKTLPASKIPTQPKSGQMGQQSRAGWKTPWKTQAKVENPSKQPKYQSPGPRSSSNGKYEGLPSSAQPKSDFYENELPAGASSSTPPVRQPEPLQQVVESFWWPESGIPLADIMRYQNCNVDRSPAEVGEPCSSKLVITLYSPRGRMIRPANPIHDPKDGEPLRYPIKMSTVDWMDKDRIRKLNRWRNAIFEHYLGPYAKAEEIQPHPLEAAFVVGKYEALEKAVDGKRLEVERELPSLARIARDYNATFEGLSLDGDRQPRPRMTREMLRKRYLVTRNDNAIAAAPGATNGEAAIVDSTISKVSMATSRPAAPTNQFLNSPEGKIRPGTRVLKPLRLSTAVVKPPSKESLSLVPKPALRISSIPRLSRLSPLK